MSTTSEEMLAAGLLPTAADMVGVTGVIHLQGFPVKTLTAS